MRLIAATAVLLASFTAGPLLADDGGGGVREIAITSAAHLADEASRKRLEYLAGCALDANTMLVGEANGETYRFAGDMGLAPGWADGAITPRERRLVSACILARTNLFGVPVRISMRSTAGPASLTTDPEEARSHDRHEGGFFGDIFAAEPVAYVCVEPGHAARQAPEEAMQRVCTHPSGTLSPQGLPLSRCGFVIVEGCGGDGGVEIGGRRWSEIIHVYLPQT